MVYTTTDHVYVYRNGILVILPSTNWHNGMDWTGGKGSREVANIFLHALLDIWGVKKLKVRLGPKFRPHK